METRQQEFKFLDYVTFGAADKGDNYRLDWCDGQGNIYRHEMPKELVELHGASVAVCYSEEHMPPSPVQKCGLTWPSCEFKCPKIEAHNERKE